MVTTVEDQDFIFFSGFTAIILISGLPVRMNTLTMHKEKIGQQKVNETTNPNPGDRAEFKVAICPYRPNENYRLQLLKKSFLSQQWHRNSSRTISGISDTLDATGTPCFLSLAILDRASPSPPSTIAPACPMRLSGGADIPAI